MNEARFNATTCAHCGKPIGDQFNWMSIVGEGLYHPKCFTARTSQGLSQGKDLVMVDIGKLQEAWARASANALTTKKVHEEARREENRASCEASNARNEELKAWEALCSARESLGLQPGSASK